MEWYNLKIFFAGQKEEEDLRQILWEYSMDLAGDVEEHLIVKKEDEVVAGGKIIQYEDSHYFLEVLGVKHESLKQGIGALLLSEIVKEPWKHCKDVTIEVKPQHFQISTLARGSATGFYKKFGFKACGFNEIPEPYQDQCEFCPDAETCNPVPMILNGGRNE
jgi:N-acetylglutamate synthase-like GNAT family acetyltransferase